MLAPGSARHKKRLRGKKARARQRSGYDLRQSYRERDLPAEHIGIATIEDPYSPPGYLDAEGNLNTAARLAPAQHADGSEAPGAPGWTPPRRPTMTVFVALKDDPVGRMHSRHQLDNSQFKAARLYQLTADQAMLGTMRSIDLSRTKVSGGMPPDPLPDSRRKAMERLRAVEERVTRRYGSEGLGLTRPSWWNGNLLRRRPGCVAPNPIARCGSGVRLFRRVPRCFGHRVRLRNGIGVVPAAAAEWTRRAGSGARSEEDGRGRRAGGFAAAIGASERARVNRAYKAPP